nr:VOC family protein [Nakamurella endophytica]
MTSRILNISVDCARPYELALFWSWLLGVPVDPDADPGDVEVGLPLGNGGHLIFQVVPEHKVVKNRLHLCLEPDGPREDEVARVLELGAMLVDDLRRPDGRGWAVLADPEGNEFCVLRSAAERASIDGSTDADAPAADPAAGTGPAPN